MTMIALLAKDVRENDIVIKELIKMLKENLENVGTENSGCMRKKWA